MLSDIENFAGCTRAKVGKSSEWNSVVKSAEEYRANVSKALDRKPILIALHGMYTEWNEGRPEDDARVGKSGADNKTSLEPIAQDEDFREL